MSKLSVIVLFRDILLDTDRSYQGLPSLFRSLAIFGQLLLFQSLFQDSCLISELLCIFLEDDDAFGKRDAEAT